MTPTRAIAAARAVLVFAAWLAPAAATAEWPPRQLENLQVLPRDTKPDSVVQIMRGFTRALGVRCTHCHVGEEGKPLGTFDFVSDAKLPKRQARAMMRMVQSIHDGELARLEGRSQPPVPVTCITCHHGTRKPRTLQDVLLTADAAGGADSLLRAYSRLRERWYGGFAYDFGEVPLADVATALAERDRLADAERVHALNVEMNPKSNFAKQQHASIALTAAFAAPGGAAAGRSRYQQLAQSYGTSIVGEPFVNRIGYAFLAEKNTAAAVEVLKLNAEEHPQSANAHDSLAEAQAAAGDVQGAIRSYERSLAIDPKNKNAAEKLASLRSKPQR